MDDRAAGAGGSAAVRDSGRLTAAGRLGSVCGATNRGGAGLPASGGWNGTGKRELGIGAAEAAENGDKEAAGSGDKAEGMKGGTGKLSTGGPATRTRL